eukprot:ctg_3382.g553
MLHSAGLLTCVPVSVWVMTGSRPRSVTTVSRPRWAMRVNRPHSVTKVNRPRSGSS